MKMIDANVEAVREMLKRRAEIGLVKYGVTTERTDLDLAAWVQHALEEVCDLAVYLTRIKAEIQQSVKVNGDGVAVDRSVKYRSMDDCPLNAKVLLLTNDGVAVLGKINAQEARKLYAGWFPLPKKDK